MFKRVSFSIILNLIIALTISAILSVFKVQPYLSKSGINLTILICFCLIWGFTGSIISLLFSKIIAKKAYKIQIIDPKTTIPELKYVLFLVSHLAKKAGLSKCPEVGVYMSDEINAFATGPTKNRAMVALSSGLLYQMNENQLLGVIGHEISHIANGDMITMALLQGIVNSSVLFFSRILSKLFSRDSYGNERPLLNIIFTLFFEITLNFLGAIFLSWVSRQREYRADLGSARLIGKEKMIDALSILLNNQRVGFTDARFQVLKIAGSNYHWWSALFATHPRINNRINRLCNLESD